MQIFLELSGHPKANIKRVALAGNTVIGRSKKCGLQIASASVSRKHCEIRLGEESATIVDLGSSNGTYLASERLAAGQEHPLPEGARLNIGGIRFLVSYTKPDVSTSPASSKPDEAAPLAAAAAATPASDDLLGDDEPLPLDDGDSLIGFGDEPASPAETPVAEPTPAAEIADDEDAPLVVEEEDVVSMGATREVSIQDTGEEPILGGEDLLLGDDEDVLLVDAEDAPARNEPVAPPASEEPIAQDSMAETSESENLFEESAESPRDAVVEEPILGAVDDDEPILVFDESDEPLADNVSSEAGTDPGDSAIDFGDTEREQAADEQAGAAEPESRENLVDDEEIEEAALVDEEPADEESILESDDEDDAFAFLNDDDDTAKPKSKAKDSELGDFLSQLGHE